MPFLYQTIRKQKNGLKDIISSSQRELLLCDQASIESLGLIQESAYVNNGGEDIKNEVLHERIMKHIYSPCKNGS
jgi:hypothetical protein